MGSVNAAECQDVDKIRRSVPISESIVQSDTEKEHREKCQVDQKRILSGRYVPLA